MAVLVCLCICLYAGLCVHVWVVCVCIHVCVLLMFVYMYIYIYIYIYIYNLYKQELKTVVHELLACTQPYSHETFTALGTPTVECPRGGNMRKYTSAE